MFPNCKHCGQRFGPRQNKRHVFCAQACHYAWRRAQPRKPRARPTQAARRAQRRVAYLVASGQMIKPDTCEHCGQEAPLEAAHENYEDPERVRWLCRSCHRRWDHAEPKGGTVQENAKP